MCVSILIDEHIRSDNIFKGHVKTDIIFDDSKSVSTKTRVYTV